MLTCSRPASGAVEHNLQSTCCAYHPAMFLVTIPMFNMYHPLIEALQRELWCLYNKHIIIQELLRLDNKHFIQEHPHHPQDPADIFYSFASLAHFSAHTLQRSEINDTSQLVETHQAFLNSCVASHESWMAIVYHGGLSEYFSSMAELINSDWVIIYGEQPI